MLKTGTVIRWLIITAAIMVTLYVDKRKKPEKDSLTIEMRKTGNDRWE